MRSETPSTPSQIPLTGVEGGVPICDRCLAGEVGWLIGQSIQMTCVRCRMQPTISWYAPRIQDQHQVYNGNSPLWFSTTDELALISRLVFDPNGWYRDLGVSTDASRRDIMERLVEIGDDRDDHLTYVAKMLLDPVVRARYDALPFGSLYFDRYIEEAQDRLDRALKAQQIQEGELDADDVWDTAGGLKQPEPSPRSPRLGLTPATREAVPNVVAYWVWGVGPDHFLACRWQQVILKAFRAAGVLTRVSVGLMAAGDSSIRIVAKSSGPVLYLAVNAADDYTMSQVGAMLAEHVRSI